MLTVEANLQSYLYVRVMKKIPINVVLTVTAIFAMSLRSVSTMVAVNRLPLHDVTL
jgi:hypothetical protein